jgi:hypothetical protein
MSREARRFRNADVDTGLIDDPKLRRLVRGSGDEGTAARAIVGYIATLLTSWDQGDRVSLEDAAPAWLTDLDDLRARLAEAGLLDSDGRIVEHAWASWYAPAATRLKQTQERWRRANEKRHRDATARSPRGNRGDTVRSVPSAPPVGSLSEEIRRRADVAALIERIGTVTPAQVRVLDEIIGRHDENGPQWAAGLVEQCPIGVDPLAHVMERDRAWQRDRRLTADAAERSWAATKQAERSAAERRQPVEATA